MTYDPRIHHRRSIRLRGHDYSGGGSYFVTCCVEGKECLFGRVVEATMLINEVVATVNSWFELTVGSWSA